MRFSDFWLLWKGHNDKVWREHDLIRLQTSILYHPLAASVKNPPKFNRLWPGGKKEESPESTLERAKKRLKKFKEEEALRKFNEKNGTNTKDRG